MLQLLLTQTGTTCPGMVLLTMSWALPYQYYEENASESCLQVSLMEAFSQARHPLCVMTLAYVNLAKVNQRQYSCMEFSK